MTPIIPHIFYHNRDIWLSQWMPGRLATFREIETYSIGMFPELNVSILPMKLVKKI
jgi:hypothetical protein